MRPGSKRRWWGQGRYRSLFRVSNHITGLETKRWPDSKQWVHEFRKRKKLGLELRTIRVSRKQVQKLVELGYLSLESKGDAQAEGVAVEAYLADSL
jgi:hypothetical protein